MVSQINPNKCIKRQNLKHSIISRPNPPYFKQLIGKKLYELTFHSLSKPKRSPRIYSPEEKKSGRRYKRFKARTAISCSFGDGEQLFKNTVLETLSHTDKWLSSYGKVKPELIIGYFVANPSLIQHLSRIYAAKLKGNAQNIQQNTSNAKGNTTNKKHIK